MKVLHVWNTAAVPSILSKYLRRRGIISDVIARRIFDKYGFEKIYANNTTYYDVSAKNFYILALKKAANYDIIHVHSIDYLVPLIRIRYKKPVLLHYHGTDIRDKGKLFIKKVYRRFSNIILVSTFDLLLDLPLAIYMPNPVDTDIFKPIYSSNKKGKALFFLKYPDTEDVIDIVKKFAKEWGLKLEIYDRRYKREFILYKNLPKLYSRYEYFIDRIILKDLSKMAIEALACGVKVVKEGKKIHRLPKQYCPFRIIDRLIEIYESLL